MAGVQGMAVRESEGDWEYVRDGRSCSLVLGCPQLGQFGGWLTEETMRISHYTVGGSVGHSTNRVLATLTLA